MITCLENLEMSGNLTAVREMSGILLKVREMSEKSGLKLFIISYCLETGHPESMLDLYMYVYMH